MTLPEPVDPTLQISRYMSFATFMSILRTGKMYFPAAGTFGDKHEGSGTILDEAHYDGVLDALNAFANYGTAVLDFDMPPEQRSELKAQGDAIRNRERTIETPFGEIAVTAERPYRQVLSALRMHLDVSCWHKNVDESLAMWKIYGGSAESVCLESTVGALDESLLIEPHEQKVLAAVKYIDHQKNWFESAHALSSVTHKQKPYSFEEEIRAVVWTSDADVFEPRSRAGRLIPVALPSLVKRLRLSPEAQPWFRALVEDVVKDVLRVEVEQSIINRGPIL